METLLANTDQLARLCNEVDVEPGLDALTRRLQELVPGAALSRVLTRGNWHRLGGVIDGAYQPVSDNITLWAERESGGDVDELIAKYLGKGYFATRLAGKTHYLTAPCGEGAEDFIQLEIEELQEVLDRPLVDPDWFPDSLEEFIDPLDYPRLEPEPVGKARYIFRRITPVRKLLEEIGNAGHGKDGLQRFFTDWSHSSASETGPFCRYWVLVLQHYTDSDSESHFTARPVSTFSGELPVLPPGGSLQGAELANAIHDYDRELGYPFAWYFIMLSHKSANYALAEAVLRDQTGAYDYIPARDLEVLQRWERRPYAV